MSAALSFSHGANDAQKAVGVIAALLVADGQIDSLAAPEWATLACAVALTPAPRSADGGSFAPWAGGSTGSSRSTDWRARAASAGVILGASLLGAPTSTTQVVASSVVGVGGGRRRWRHVHWAIVRQMGIAWLITMPITAFLAAAALFLQLV